MSNKSMTWSLVNGSRPGIMVLVPTHSITVIPGDIRPWDFKGLCEQVTPGINDEHIRACISLLQTGAVRGKTRRSVVRRITDWVVGR